MKTSTVVLLGGAAVLAYMLMSNKSGAGNGQGQGGGYSGSGQGGGYSGSGQGGGYGGGYGGYGLQYAAQQGLNYSAGSSTNNASSGGYVPLTSQASGGSSPFSWPLNWG